MKEFIGEKCQFENLPGVVDSLRIEVLFCEESDSLPPIAMQHFLVAMSQMEIAVASLKLANYYRMRKD